MFTLRHEGIRGKGVRRVGTEAAGRASQEGGGVCAKALRWGQAGGRLELLKGSQQGCGRSLLWRKQCKTPRWQLIYIHFNMFSGQLK